MNLLKLASLLLLSLFIIQCKKDGPKDLLVRKWRLTGFVPDRKFNFPDSVKNALISSLTLEFTSDNEYTQFAMGFTQKGNYKMDATGKLITYTSPDLDGAFTDTILILTKDKLSIIEEGGNRKTFKGD